MKKGPTLILKGVVIVLGAIVLALIIGFAIACIPIVIAIFALVLQKLFQSVIDMRP